VSRPEITGRKYLSTSDVGRRYGVVPRTVNRWWKAATLPPPDLTIHTHHYWDEKKLDQRDCQHAARKDSAA
jgi:hypothetical protein